MVDLRSIQLEAGSWKLEAISYQFVSLKVKRTVLVVNFYVWNIFRYFGWNWRGIVVLTPSQKTIRA